MSIDGRIKKLWSMPALEGYSGLKRNNILTLVTTWINLESMRLRVKSQTQKATYMIPFIGNVQKRQVRGQRADGWLPGGWEGGTGDNLVSSGYSSELMKMF